MIKGFYNGERVPNYSGVCTIYELPFKADLAEMDFAVAGFTFEGGSVNRAETRYAPSAIRNHVSFKGDLGYSEIMDVDISEYLQGTDLGEAETKFGYKIPSLNSIKALSLEVAKSNTVLIGMGGGQLCTLAELRAMKEAYGPVALIHFDSERDCMDYEEKYDDSTVVIRAVEEGLIDTTKSIRLGIRGGYSSKAECEYGKNLGMSVLTATQMYSMSENDVIKAIEEKIGDAPCFISLDLSFLDPVYAPGVTTPSVGGFTTHYLHKIIRNITKNLSVKGFDVVDLTTAYDSGKVAAQEASAVIQEALCGMAKKKQNGGK